ncbi:hypothetical protein GLOIN_2v1765053 [Rhizophagus clarus]|uniref:Uncharacterized protein n=1 Tax=Rhizophagus clarus TaxID=94130 RepID=A0A8H3M7L1_9GLOM|nr:hypothetical protein GLOIN_2v1765053 [Rhizophagus clarus]
MYWFVQGGRFAHRIDQDIAFPSEILDIIRQDRINQTVSRQYNEILDKIDEMKQNQHSGWIYEYGKKIFLEISAYQPLRGSSHFALPKIWAKPQLGIINPKNTDNRCFEECLKAHLASEEARRQGTRARNLHDDLEADSDPVEKNDIKEKTIKLQKQKPNSYGYALMQTDGKLAKEIARRTPNSIAESWESMQRDLEEIIKPKLRNPEKIKMTERDWRTHKSAIRCYICEERLQETRYNKVKYFDTSQKFLGGAHYGCVKIKCETTEENLSEAVYRTEGLSIEEENTFKKATKCCLCKMSLRTDINDNRYGNWA